MSAQKVKLKVDINVGGVERKKGDVVKVSSSLYANLILEGNAVKYVPKAVKKEEEG